MVVAWTLPKRADVNAPRSVIRKSESATRGGEEKMTLRRTCVGSVTKRWPESESVKCAHQAVEDRTRTVRVRV